MDEHEHENEKPTETGGAKVSRRNFIGAFGAAAAAAALLESLARQEVKGQSPQQTVWYQDSFGNVVPAGSGTLALGITPPPLPPGVQPPTTQQPQSTKGPHGPQGPIRTEAVEGGRRHPHGRIHPETEGGGGCSSTTTYYSQNSPLYNILLIMVDQMRNPYFWPPPGGSVFNSIPNITTLMNTSFIFPNFFAAATVCSPSRACFLTGLYSQQHCIFKVLNPQATNSDGDPVSPLAPPPLIPYNPNWATTSVNPGLPTIGNVLSQTNIPIAPGCTSNGTPFNCTWIGKWHLSCGTGSGERMVDGPGYHGPSDYGFGDYFCIPASNINTTETNYPASSYPSPDGLNNEGTGGDFLDSETTAHSLAGARDNVEFCTETTSPFGYSTSTLPPLVQLNDAAIAFAFTNYWLPYAKTAFDTGSYGGATGNAIPNPWFCAVSFVNPHDMTEFPYSYGLVSASGGCPATYTTHGFCGPVALDASNHGFLVPAKPTSTGTPYYGTGALAVNATGGVGDVCPVSCASGSACQTACDAAGDVTTVSPVSTAYSSLPAGWNYENVAAMPYGATPTFSSKPGLQAYFWDQRNNIGGGMEDPGTNAAGWETFLNYYLWMQNCVDQQVYNILYGPKGLQQTSSDFWANTIIIFTSDHGDYAGSHSLHAKGGALYEEVINVPLFISFPQQRTPTAQSAPVVLPYVCSAVDILPFIYSMALGNESWRSDPVGMVYYLNNRESIADAIMEYNGEPACNNQVVPQRRLSTIPLGNPPVVYCPNGATNCPPPWAQYQPYVLHTADDYPAAFESPYGTGSIPQPSHAIAFRTADPTAFTASSAGCPTTQPVPANGATLYAGGKLGVYSYWNTCNPTTPNAPILPISSADGVNPQQYELYYYSGSSPNVIETNNDYFTTGGAVTTEGGDYYSAFTTSAVQDELYNLNLAGATSGSPTYQVQAAIQAAYDNYILWLTCNSFITDNTGKIISVSESCPDEPGTGTQPPCPTCASDTSCIPNSYIGDPAT